MFATNDSGQMEYAALTSRSRSLERTGQAAWVASSLAAAVLFAWAVRSGSPALMLPVVLAAAVGWHAWSRANQQVRLIAGYLEECAEDRASGAQWHTKLAQLRSFPAASASDEWVAAAVANLVMVAAIVCSWIFAEGGRYGELFAGFVTALGVMFAFHSVTETARAAQTDYAGIWRKAGPRDGDRQRNAA